MVYVSRNDLGIILDHIRIAEQHAAGTPLTELVADPLLALGLRTVDGSFNNLTPGRENVGAADQTMPRLLESTFLTQPAEAHTADLNVRTQQPTSYTQTSGSVYDAEPRIISNLVADQTLNNPAVIAAALKQSGLTGQALLDAAEQISAAHRGLAPAGTLETLLATHGIQMDGNNVLVPDVSPDEGLSAPYNSWMTLFGQFFDHGLDLVGKGGSGTVYIPLQRDDPLYVEGSPTNFMVLTRATNQPGLDGILGTADDVREHMNKTTPWVDQNQTYSSHPSYQVFLRAYELDGGRPAATGELLHGVTGGMSTWGDLKAQAANLLGIRLNDTDVLDGPLLATDLYGNFIPGPNGLPQLVVANPDFGTVVGAPEHILVEGNLANPVDASQALRNGHAFLEDIAHNAVPGTFVVNRFTGETAQKAADADVETGNVIVPNQFGQNETYDNELLDRHFIAGDGRGNENFGLTAVHHMFHSEHNRQVTEMKQTILESGELAFINEWLRTPITEVDLANVTADSLSWDGERLFQSAKFATEMQYQHLAFEEFGRRVQPQIGIFMVNASLEIDPAIFAEFAHVVYRFGHSMLTENVHTMTPDAVNTTTDLITAFLNPVAYDQDLALTADQAAGAVVRGMTREVGANIDEFITSALRDNLVGLPLDLAALNIARGRDTGVPSLNQAREAFYKATGNEFLEPYSSWGDYAASLKNPASIVNFIAAYGNHETIVNATTVEEKRAAATDLVLGGANAPSDRLDFLHGTGAWANQETGINDVEFWIGGLAEKIMPFGGMLGTTFGFVFQHQMESLQNADRFYYLSRTNGMNMLGELENNSFASIIIKNSDIKDGGAHIPADIFAAMQVYLEVDQRFQADPDPTSEEVDPFMAAMGTQMVERATGTVNAPLTSGVLQYDNLLKYNGGEHAVLGGTSGRDILIGGLGDDALWGDDGDDLLIGGSGVNTFRGGAGNDIIKDGDDISFLHGEDGDDVISAGGGIGELIFGGRGNDAIMVGADDGKHTFAGMGNDFVIGGSGTDVVDGGEGDDWLEGGDGYDFLFGDNNDNLGGSRVIGHDVLNGGPNDNDLHGESGDDIHIQGEGTHVNLGELGFDWVAHKTMNAGVAIDLTDRIVPEQAEFFADRYIDVEAVSGTIHNDRIWGDNRMGGDLPAGVPVLDNTATLFGNELTQEGVDRIAGLRELLGELMGNDPAGTFTGGNILLGGSGSDTIQGRGGDDVIDGDKYLNVRISIRDANDPTVEIRTIDSLREITSELLDGSISPSQLQIVREILDGGAEGDIDTAVYYDIRANYDVRKNADGSFNVTHVNVTTGPNLIDPINGDKNPETGDGTDRLTNIERLEFADGELYIVNIPASGAPDISDTTPTENQTLTADPGNIIDLNGFGPDPMQYQWQISRDAGQTWTNITGATTDAYRPSQPEVGAVLRVQVSFIDGLGNPETVYSLATAAVVDSNVAPTGALTINDTTPDVGQLLQASSLNIRDANGFNPLLTPQTFQWESSSDGVTWTTITGATASSYRPVTADAGLQLRAKVSFTDGEGTVETVASAATTAVAAAVVVGRTINGTVVADTLTGGEGNDTITGGLGNDTISAGAGDDTINWTVRNPVFLLGTITDGVDIINGGTEGALGDTFVINGNNTAETFRIYTATAWTGLGGGRTVTTGTDIVITRNGTAQNNIIAQLSEIEEIVINGSGAVTANDGGGLGAGTIGGDTIQVFGDFTTTALNYSTITVNGSDGNDTVDISNLESAHRIVFRSAGGNDTVVGTLRPQDVIEVPVGADPANYVATDNDDGTVTMASGTHSVTFVGALNALPTLASGTPAGEDGGTIVSPPNGPALTARDAAGLLALVRGLNPDGNDDAANALGVRTLTGEGNNLLDPTQGAHGEPFIRITPNRSGEFDAAVQNNALNPVFDGLDPRNISNIIGTQEAGTAKSADANIFFMAFAQYFDHGLSFIPKGGNGSVQIGDFGTGARAQNPADLTRATVDGFDANGAAQHLNITSPYVDQNQVYGSTNLIGQFLRESDGNGGLGARVLLGVEDPSAPGFQLLPTLRGVLEHHIDAGTVFVGADLPNGGQTLLEYYPTLLNADGTFNPDIVRALAGNFMGEGQPLLLDANPFINLLDHIVAGDGRVNENITLTSMHTIFARNHNYHVDQLEALYDANGTVLTLEELFQAAKIVNEAEYQRVVFTEFAEKLLGGEGILGDGDHGFTEWNPTADAAISQEFASAVYRFGHTMIGQTIAVTNPDGTVQQVSLFDAFLNPTNAAGAFTQALDVLAQRGYIPQPGYTQLGAAAVLDGIAGQAAEEVDVNIVDGVRNDLVRVSADLFSFNVARGRDVGIGTLNQVKAALLASDSPFIQEALSFVPPAALQPYTSWEDFGTRNGLSPAVLDQFRAAYPDLVLADQVEADAFTALNPDITLIANPGGSFTVKGIDRVDLWVGGLAEAKVNGGIVGSTFWVVIHEQLDRLQDGDRFYYIDRLENFDLYPNFVEGQAFSDIVMRTTGLTGLDERIFEVSDEDGAPGDTGAGGGTGPGTGTGTGTVPDTGTDTGVNPIPDTNPDTGTGTGNGTGTGTGAGPDTGTSPGAGTGNGIGSGAGTPPDTVSDPEQGAGTDAGTGSGTDPSAGAGSGAGAAGGAAAAVTGVVLMPGSSAEAMVGDAGDDVIVGGAEGDALMGKAGADIMLGNDGDDVLVGGSGDDVIEGGAGRDVMLGGDGDDIFIVQLNDGSDMIFGGAGSDTLDLSAITGGAVIDLGAYTPIGTVKMGGVTDHLMGVENVIGSAGSDTIKAGLGVNVMTGGDGEDIFVFVSAGTADGDVITDFRPGDRIDLSGIDAVTGTAGNQAFTLAGQGTTAAGSLVIREIATEYGTDTLIEGFTDADEEADFTITLRGAHNLDGSSFNL